MNTPAASSASARGEARRWSPFVALGVCALVLVGVPWAFKLLSAPALGQPCGGGFDCAALDGRCVVGPEGSYCTIVCRSDDECPDGGHCGVPPDDEWRRWFAASPMSERVCVPGSAPTRPLETPGEMPKREAGAQPSGAPQSGPGGRKQD